MLDKYNQSKVKLLKVKRDERQLEVLLDQFKNIDLDELEPEQDAMLTTVYEALEGSLYSQGSAAEGGAAGGRGMGDDEKRAAGDDSRMQDAEQDGAGRAESGLGNVDALRGGGGGCSGGCSGGLGRARGRAVASSCSELGRFLESSRCAHPGLRHGRCVPAYQWWGPAPMRGGGAPGGVPKTQRAAEGAGEGEEQQAVATPRRRSARAAGKRKEPEEPERPPAVASPPPPTRFAHGAQAAAPAQASARARADAGESEASDARAGLVATRTGAQTAPAPHARAGDGDGAAASEAGMSKGNAAHPAPPAPSPYLLQVTLSTLPPPELSPACSPLSSPTC